MNSLERDCKLLKESRRAVVIVATQCTKGHVILWCNKSGYTVSSVKYSPLRYSTGGVLKFSEAVTEYKNRVDEVI